MDLTISQNRTVPSLRYRFGYFMHSILAQRVALLTTISEKEPLTFPRENDCGALSI